MNINEGKQNVLYQYEDQFARYMIPIKMIQRSLDRIILMNGKFLNW